MKNKRKRHPITIILILIAVTILLSFVLSLIGYQSYYTLVNPYGETTVVPVHVKNLLNRSGIRTIISNSFANLATFKILSYLIIGFIAIAISEVTGLLKTIFKKLDNISDWWISFIIIFIGTTSSLLNETGYVILLPFAARLFMHRKKNPLYGIAMAFSSITVGWGTTFFASGLETKLVPITKKAANIILRGFHVPLLSNIFIMLASTLVLTIIGTVVFETVIKKMFNDYQFKSDEYPLSEEEILKEELRSKNGKKYALIVFFLNILVISYMIMPGLPLSGLMLEREVIGYTNQLFGPNGYFESSFIILVFIMITTVSIAYGIGANTIKSDSELYEKAAFNLCEIGYIVLVMFFFVQFVAIFEETKIGIVVASKIANLLETTTLTGVPLIISSILVIALAGIFLPNVTLKWQIFSPILVPLAIKSNISPSFMQFIYRGGDSIFKGVTPLLGAFLIYMVMMNIFNDKDESIGIKDLLKYSGTYSLIMGIIWILFIVIWYIVGLPIGPNILPTI